MSSPNNVGCRDARRAAAGQVSHTSHEAQPSPATPTARATWVARAAAAALCVAAPAGHAARPMITDDARLVDAKSCQLEAWTKLNRTSQEFWALPACNPFGNLEISFGGARLSPRGGDVPHTSDVVLQAKTLLKPLQTNGWGLGLAVGHISHPAVNTSRNLIGDLYGYMPVSWSFGDDRVVLHLNLGALHLENTRDTRGTYGLGAEILMRPNLYLIAESFGQTRGRPFWQAGVRWWLVPGRLQVDATLGDRWGGQHGPAVGAERWFSVGLRLLSPPFMP